MRTFTVEAIVENGDRRLKPGFFAKGVILTKRDEGVIAVPDNAVSTLAGVSSVYIVRDGKITQQSVTLGVRQGDLWEVLEGLKGDETLAASRLNELATGVSVEIDAEGGEGGGRRGGGERGEGRGQRQPAAGSAEDRSEARRSQRPAAGLRGDDERRAHRARLGLVPAISGST